MEQVAIIFTYPSFTVLVLSDSTQAVLTRGSVLEECQTSLLWHLTFFFVFLGLIVKQVLSFCQILRAQSEGESRSVMSDSLPEHWSGSPSLLQGVCLTQESNPGLPHCRWILYQLSHREAQESTKALEKKDELKFTIVQWGMWTRFSLVSLLHFKKRICCCSM